MSRCYFMALAGLLELGGAAATALLGQSSADPKTLSVFALGIPGAPLEFRQVETNVRALADGSVAIEETTSTVHRDSVGRVRLEQISGPGGPFVIVTDPVEGYATVLLLRGPKPRFAPGFRSASREPKPGSPSLDRRFYQKATGSPTRTPFPKG